MLTVGWNCGKSELLAASAGLGLLATENTEKDYGIERLGTVNMNVLYKYCDQGVAKILESLELKLPYISQTNDPLECLPFFYCPDDKAAIEARYFSVLQRRGMLPSADYKQRLENGEIHKILEKSQRELQRDWNRRKGCLLSVSKNARETVMWAHYADKHKGAAIGIDLDNVFPNAHRERGILMNPVIYDKHRPKINILDEPEGNVSCEAYQKAVMTKSDSWSYEEEFRTIFLVDSLEKLQQQGAVRLKDFKGKNTWFLRLNPVSIREVIFGLYTDKSLKSDIRKLIERQDLQHVKLYQAEESETYTLNLK
ncbi:MAG: DUF2971 domain-containing protein [Desulfobacteraceae bacterium]|nr:DUF2971 domain-containing protein [Desulfobacteraceae bacterium]